VENFSASQCFVLFFNILNKISNSRQKNAFARCMACTCKYAGLKTIENMEFSLDFVHAFNLLIKIT